MLVSGIGCQPFHHGGGNFIAQCQSEVFVDIAHGLHRIAMEVQMIDIEDLAFLTLFACCIGSRFCLCSIGQFAPADHLEMGIIVEHLMRTGQDASQRAQRLYRVTMGDDHAGIGKSCKQFVEMAEMPQVFQ